MHYHFKIHKEGTGYWAQCLELIGCITEADTIEKLYENMQEALNLYIEGSDESQEFIPLPNNSISISGNIIAITVDPKISHVLKQRTLK